MGKGDGKDPRTIAAVHIADLERRVEQVRRYLEVQRRTPGRVRESEWQFLHDLQEELARWRKRHGAYGVMQADIEPWDDG